MLVSIIIRTFNEQKHLSELLEGIRLQETHGFEFEIVVVDSGSTDATLKIAAQYDCAIVHITKDEFTFGRSLNLGCQRSKGDILVFVSGHCVPVDSGWLTNLVAPIVRREASYSYGRQVGREDTKFSEKQVFNKYFPDESHVPQEGFFCNNANAALSRSAWETHRFDEEVSGLEDMELAKRLCQTGERVAYVSEAAVFHIHDERWRQVIIRYEREAYALRKIMPEIHVSAREFVVLFLHGVVNDGKEAIKAGCFMSRLGEIIVFRFCQYLGVYRGNNEHRKLSKEMKRRYFYPSEVVPTPLVKVDDEKAQTGGAAANES